MVARPGIARSPVGAACWLFLWNWGDKLVVNEPAKRGAIGPQAMDSGSNFKSENIWNYKRSFILLSVRLKVAFSITPVVLMIGT